MMKKSIKRIIKNYFYKNDTAFCNLMDEMLVKSDTVRNRARSWFHNPLDIGTKRINARAVSAACVAQQPLHVEVLTDVADHLFEIKDFTVNDYKTLSENDDSVQMMYILAFESDQKLAECIAGLEKFSKVKYSVPRIFYPTARYLHKNDLCRSVLQKESENSPGKFALADYECLIECLEITRDVKGAYVEIGVYKAGSARVVLHYMEAAHISRRVVLMDTYEGFVYSEAEKSKDAYWNGSHTDTSIEYVKERTSGFEIIPDIVKSNIIEDEVPELNEGIALCNIDVDMYEAVKAALQKAYPLMNVNGIIVLEDQGHTPALAGGWYAAKEFMDSSAGEGFIPVYKDSGQLLLIKKG